MEISKLFLHLLLDEDVANVFQVLADQFLEVDPELKTLVMKDGQVVVTEVLVRDVFNQIASMTAKQRGLFFDYLGYRTGIQIKPLPSFNQYLSDFMVLPERVHHVADLNLFSKSVVSVNYFDLWTTSLDPALNTYSFNCYFEPTECTPVKDVKVSHSGGSLHGELKLSEESEAVMVNLKFKKPTISIGDKKFSADYISACAGVHSDHTTFFGISIKFSF